MRTSVLLALATSAAILVSVGPARADVAPPDSCPTAGQACTNAGPNNDQPGTCVASTCQHPLPDGGSQSYSCTLCEAGEGGAGSSSSGSGSSTGSGSGSGSGSSGGSSTSSSSSGSSGGGGGGCAMSTTARDGITGFVMLAVGAAALAWGRRRKP